MTFVTGCEVSSCLDICVSCGQMIPMENSCGHAFQIPWMLLDLAPEHKMATRVIKGGSRAVLEVRMHRTKCLMGRSMNGNRG